MREAERLDVASAPDPKSAHYSSATALGSDGEWQVTAQGGAPYTTRIVVNRPRNPARFNGTVIVEWLNVSAGLDTAPDWVYTHTELIREGYAWVGVSAQATGLNATRSADPARYATLSHPGDSCPACRPRVRRIPGAQQVRLRCGAVAGA